MRVGWLEAFVVVEATSRKLVMFSVESEGDREAILEVGGGLCILVSCCGSCWKSCWKDGQNLSDGIRELVRLLGCVST